MTGLEGFAGARAVVYLVVDGDEQRQLGGVARHCEAHGYTVAAAVREEPGRVTGLIGALRMVDAGEADVVVTAALAMAVERAGGWAGRPQLVGTVAARPPQRGAGRRARLIR